MTGEKIIDLIKQASDKKDNSGTYLIQDIYFEGIANIIISQMEQEKKEVAREIICWFANETEKAFGKNYLAERIAKEYGVEL